MKKSVIFVFLFLVLGVSVIVSAQDVRPPSVNDRFTLGKVYWAFEGNLTNENGKVVSVLFGLVNLSWDTTKGKYSEGIAYLNVEGEEPLYAYRRIFGAHDNQGKRHLTFDFLPLQFFPAIGLNRSELPLGNSISLIFLDIPFNSSEDIISSNEIFLNEIKISKMTGQFSLNEFSLNNPTAEELFNRSGITDRSKVEYFPFGQAGIVTESGNNVFGCYKSFGSSLGGSITEIGIDCESICFDHYSDLYEDKILIRETTSFCLVNNPNIISVTTNTFDLNELKNPIERFAGTGQPVGSEGDK